MDKATYCETIRRDLTDVRIRMNEIRRRLPAETGSERIRDVGDLAMLERREAALVEKLGKARSMPDMFWSRMKTELTKALDDVMGVFSH